MSRIAVIAGDGVGREVVPAAVRAARAAAGERLEWTEFDWNADYFLRHGAAMPPDGLEQLRRFDAILFGAVGDPRIGTHEYAAGLLLKMRFGLDLYANLRPVRPLDDRLCPLRGIRGDEIDFVVLRENTEGAYAGIGGNFKSGRSEEVAIELDLNTRLGVERIQRLAFETARQRPRRRLVMADKSNAMPHAHGLWLRVFRELRPQYPEVEAGHLYADALAYQMVRDPRQFDVIVTSNLFGDLLTDLAAALQGGLGMAASANLHPGRLGLFEPVHGSAPDIAGRNRANPLGAILSAALMLDFLGLGEAARQIEAAAAAAVREGVTTPDLGGNWGTMECAAWIEKRLRA